MNNIRKNHFCVISKETFTEYQYHDIQTNSRWEKNPYNDEYAVVPDSMVQDILKTQGFCDIVLNESGTEVISFTVREIPDIPEPEEPELSSVEEITTEEMANAIMEGVNDI